MHRPTRPPMRGRLIRLVKRAKAARRCAGVVATACTQGNRRRHGKPLGVIRDDQPETREGCSGRFGVAERPVVPEEPGNAGGGKGPWFKTDAGRRKEQEIGQPINSRSVQRLQMALHAKVKVSSGFRFIAFGMLGEPAGDHIA